MSIPGDLPEPPTFAPEWAAPTTAMPAMRHAPTTAHQPTRYAEAFARLPMAELRELVDALRDVSDRNATLANLYYGAQDSLTAREACGCTQCAR